MEPGRFVFGRRGNGTAGKGNAPTPMERHAFHSQNAIEKYNATETDERDEPAQSTMFKREQVQG